VTRPRAAGREMGTPFFTDSVIIIGGLKSMGFTKPPPTIMEYQRSEIFILFSPPIQTTSSLIWGYFFIWTDCSRYEYVTRGKDEV